jgi:hypothetical protein
MARYGIAPGGGCAGSHPQRDAVTCREPGGVYQVARRGRGDRRRRRVCAEPLAGSVIRAAARRCQRAPRAHRNESQNRGIVARLLISLSAAEGGWERTNKLMSLYNKDALR